MKIFKKSLRWYFTKYGDPRGYIQPGKLKELWFHTGTRCNLGCDFCLEGASPNSTRLNAPKMAEVKPYIDQALAMGVEKFSFTGGEPFLVKDIIKILDYASQYRPVLVLTNGTEPLLKRLHALSQLRDNPNPIALRISLDKLNPASHDAHRGQGTFARALAGLKAAHQKGFPISIARQMEKGEDSLAIERGFRELFRLNGLPQDLSIVSFPDFLAPGAHPDLPEISENCMTHYQSQESRAQFMCHFSKMIVKRNGKLQIYACTLVDDDPEYEMSGNLADCQKERISMKHHRCYSCFKYGSSCSEK